MYEVTQNVDLSSKVDALSKKFDQLLALNTLPTNSPNMQENHRANYHEQAKAVITLRSGKKVDNKVGEPIKDKELNENETEEIDIETKIEKNVVLFWLLLMPLLIVELGLWMSL
ncbi:hypothetical protein M9H77_21627 [Catharanthus roseus]|uniref:Uncharacterized protein n=1 Tax=Catharanthus roseus TaxID=4058 RepID=A0ACC0AN93_CATRO|nr:hypothetical protein M9H77_21627 [Catharanthus roseus]